MAEFGYKLLSLIESPILGGTSGNKEFLGLFVPAVKDNNYNLNLI
jgi:hypothetical protein